MPYASWFDFAFGIRHPESLVNFIAAYGMPPDPHHVAAGAPLTVVIGDRGGSRCVDRSPTSCSPTRSRRTGVDNIDLWMGGLAEKLAPFGGMLGTTFNYVFEMQLENLQNADRFYYLERLDGLNLLAQLEGNSFAELIARNTTADRRCRPTSSRGPDFVFNVGALSTPHGNPRANGDRRRPGDRRSTTSSMSTTAELHAACRTARSATAGRRT